jgi:nucleoside-diphosphate-sugar epimerase
MHIAVTGGAGFIGQCVVQKLMQCGHDVLVLDLKSNDGQRGITRTVDITNLAQLVNHLRGIDVVYHIAGPVLESFRRDPYSSQYLQETGTLNVLEAGRLNNVGKIVFASSFYTYCGLDERMIVNEQTPLDIKAMNVFGVSKFMSEEFVRAYSTMHGLRYVILRFGSAYGWGECSNTVKTFIETGLRGNPIAVWGRGSRRNQYTYVEDIADGCARVLHKVNETYNLVSPEETTTCELAYLLRDAFGFNVEFKEAQREAASAAYMSSRKAMKQLSWVPVTIRQGLAAMMAQANEKRVPASQEQGLEKGCCG